MDSSREFSFRMNKTLALRDAQVSMAPTIQEIKTAIEFNCSVPEMSKVLILRW